MSATADATPHRNAPLFLGSALVATGLYLGLSLWSADVTLDPRAAAEACWTGRFGCYAAFYARVTVGTLPALAAAVLCCLWGVHVVRGGRFWSTWPQVAGGALTVAALSLLMTTATRLAANPYYGGLTGLAVAPAGVAWFGAAGVFGLGILGLIMGGALVFGEHIRLLFRACA
ncbi:MAG: DNA translocase FtsK 4TM domain-containing protein, partial [Planctomycetota bacterium]